MERLQIHHHQSHQSLLSSFAVRTAAFVTEHSKDRIKQHKDRQKKGERRENVTNTIDRLLVTEDFNSKDMLPPLRHAANGNYTASLADSIDDDTSFGVEVTDHGNVNDDSEADDGKYHYSSDNDDVSLDKSIYDMSEKERQKPLRALLAALSFERTLKHPKKLLGKEPKKESSNDHETNNNKENSNRFTFYGNKTQSNNYKQQKSSRQQQQKSHDMVDVHHILRGTLDPDGQVEEVYFDAYQYGDGKNIDEFKVNYQRESVVLASIVVDDKVDNNINNNNDVENSTNIEAYLREHKSSGGFQSTSHSMIRSASQKQHKTTDNDNKDYVSDVSETGMDDNNDDSSLTSSYDTNSPYFSSPPPPKELPLRFLRAGKGDPTEGLKRYQATLQWRKENNIDNILREAHPHFELIKQHYPHYYHGRGRNNEPCFFELPPKTNLKALKKGGVTLEMLLRHYAMITEFGWQYLERDDLAQSMYIIDLDGIRLGDFVGEAVDFVRKASAFTSQHYPERAGCVYVINVPGWFKLIWNVVKPMVDEATLRKIFILRGQDEIKKALAEKISPEYIPSEYGGQGGPLGQSPEEKLLADIMAHNNAMANANGICPNGGRAGSCRFCSWVPARSY